MKLPQFVKIREVGPRDGLQNEKIVVPTAEKIRLVNELSKTGLDYIEVSSFVRPDWIPQLADAEEVFKAIERNKNITYAALVPNMTGLKKALQSNVDEISVFMSASEGHNMNNINKTIDATFPILEEVVSEAIKAGKSVRGYVSTVIACPYDGPTKPKQVKYVVDHLLEMGVQEISLGDTIGVGVPNEVEALLDELFPLYNAQQFAMHFHDTNGTAIANIIASLPYGITKFDSSIGGLGGCPYAKGASGNVSTEDLLYVFNKMGIETNIDFKKYMQVARFIENEVKRPLKSKQMEILRGVE